MIEDQPLHIEAYALSFYDVALTHLGPDSWPRAELERAVTARPVVPLRVGETIVGTARLSVDERGLRVSADVDAPRKGAQ